MRKRLRAFLSAAVALAGLIVLLLFTFGAMTGSAFAEMPTMPTRLVASSFSALPDGMKLIALGTGLLGLSATMRKWA